MEARCRARLTLRANRAASFSTKAGKLATLDGVTFLIDFGAGDVNGVVDFDGFVFALTS